MPFSSSRKKAAAPTSVPPSAETVAKLRGSFGDQGAGPSSEGGGTDAVGRWTASPPAAPPGAERSRSASAMPSLVFSKRSSLSMSRGSSDGGTRARERGRHPLVLSRPLRPLSCAQRTILGDLTLLVGESWDHAQLVMGSGHHSSHQIETDKGNRWGQVHHYWEEGIAVHTDIPAKASQLLGKDAIVLEVELFGDAHQFHLRTLGQPLWPGLAFGSTRQQVEAALGVATLMIESKGPNGWAFYRDWRAGGGGCASCVAAGSPVMLGLYYERPQPAAEAGTRPAEPAAAPAVAAEPAAAAAAAAAGSAGWELQSVRIFLCPPSVESGEAARRTSDAGASCESKPAPLTPGQSLARLWQGENPAALRAREYELQSNMLIQAAGHGMFARLSDRVLVKQLEAAAGRNERQAYAAINGEAESALEPFASRCFHVVERDALTLLYIEDLTASYAKPCVMDIKMGTRTFLEDEVSNQKLRLDLVEKMVKVDAGAVSDAERQRGVTKMRYMQFREVMSSSATLGWRIEGIQLPHKKHPDCKQLRERGQLQAALLWFLQSRPALQRQLLARLEALREALQASRWFMSHEVVSSSLLFIYDDAEPSAAPPGVWMIDFAKTVGVPSGRVTHRETWQLGNHEDGYFVGLDSLIGTMRELDCNGSPPGLNGEHAGPAP